MKTRILGYVAREINRLTSDEDIRQELWLYFLEGNSLFLLETRFNSIIEKNKEHDSVITYVSMETLNGLKKNL